MNIHKINLLNTINENNIIITETNKLEFTIYRFLEVNLKTKLNQLAKKDYY